MRIAKRIAFRLHAQAENSDLHARRQDEIELRIALVEIPYTEAAALDVALADVGLFRVKLERKGRLRLDQRHVF